MQENIYFDTNLLYKTIKNKKIIENVSNSRIKGFL